MNFWEKPTNRPAAPWEQNASQVPLPSASEVTLDEQALSELQEDSNINLFEEEEENTQELMADANLRLEQGRLYQMVLQGDIFADTNADPRAIKNVQREIRKYVRERMETMLGIRQELPKQETVVSSPFNDLEVTVLKMLASKMSKGATEEAPKPTSTPQVDSVPKKDGITAISGNLRPQASTATKSTPLNSKPKTPLKPQPKTQKTPTSAINKEEDTLLTKPVAEMSPQELMQYETAAAERRARNKSALPPNLVPHPTPQQLEMMYTQSASNLTVANPWRVSGQ